MDAEIVPSTRRSNPTIYDVARLAGVSPSTVSRALNRPGRISPATVAKIRSAADELDFRANPMARALPTGRSQTFGMLVADITNPMFFEVARGAERAAAAHGYTLVIAESQESDLREAEAAERVLPSVDGMILVTTRLTDAEITRLAHRKPLVVLNREVDGVESVVADIVPGVDQAIAHLHDLGHRTLAFLSGPARSWMSSARQRVLQSRAAARGLSVTVIGPGEPSRAGGRAALSKVVASGATAVIAYNDLMAIGLLQAAQEVELAVPAAFSIVGFDDIFGADLTTPALTTVRTPLAQMGALAVDAILKAADAPSQPLFAPLETQLVIRRSTGPARLRGADLESGVSR
jgi:LacI family transcriptional regulator